MSTEQNKVLTRNTWQGSHQVALVCAASGPAVVLINIGSASKIR